jgi:hypothetical protein
MHALVVGCSQYEFLTEDGSPGPGGRETFGLRQVKTPATCAFRFARWLDSSYRNPSAPLGTVRLFRSPSPFESTNDFTLRLTRTVWSAAACHLSWTEREGYGLESDQGGRIRASHL